jgi:hypothetical protein
MVTWVSRVAILAVIASAPFCGGSRTMPTASMPGSIKVAELPPMVHLRRLHLVRPDLIPYPIDIEVLC